MTDINNRLTHTRRAQAAPRRESALFRHIVDDLPDGMALTENDAITYANTAFASLLGLLRGDIVGQPLSRYLPDDAEEVLATALDRAAEGKVATLETQLVRADSTRILVELVIRMTSSAGSDCFTILARDLTDRAAALAAVRNAEEQLRQSQKLEAVGRLAGGVAHDFNNLLTVISCCTEMALSQGAESGPIRTELLEVRSASKRAADLTRQLLAFSRKQMLLPRALDLDEVIADSARMLRRLVGEQIRIELAPSSETIWVAADRTQLGQVLLNLVVNARDAMPNGGRVSLKTQLLDFKGDRSIGADIAPAGHYACITIRDEGVGMDEDTRARAFEPFFTTKDPGLGTGLGLSTVHGIVRQSGGFIDVTSEVGRGTTVCVYIPVAAPDGGSASPDDSAARRDP